MDQKSISSKIPLGVDINCDPVAENIWAFKKQEDGTSTADQQLVSNTGFHFEGGVANLHQNQYSDQNNPSYSYVTEGGNVIELRPAGNDPTSSAPMNGVYLDGKFLDNVPAHGLESVLAIQGNYDDVIMTDSLPVGLKVLGNSSNAQIVSGTGASSWSFITTTAPAGNWKSVSYGNGVWIAVAQTTSTTAGIARSTDGGATWSFVTTPAPANAWNSVAYGNGVWIAVASSSSTTSAVARSTDNGLTWSFVNCPAHGTLNLSSVSFGGGIWVLLWDGALANGIARSTDGGATWSVSTAPAINSGWRCAAYGSGVWIAVCRLAGTTNGVAMSTDNAQTWTFITVPIAGDWFSVSYGNGKFVATNYTASISGSISSSDNGYTWSALSGTTLGGPIQSVTYGNNVWAMVADTTSTTLGISRSTDNAVTWSQPATSAPGGNWRFVAYGDGVWIAIATTTSTTAGIARSVATYSSSLNFRLDEIGTDGSISRTSGVKTITNAGYGRPVALVKQALGSGTFTWASTQYIVAADAVAATGTYNIFSDAGVAQIGGTKIPNSWSGGSPQNIWCAKMSATEYLLTSMGLTVAASTILANTSGTVTAYGQGYSWAVMQSRLGKNRVLLTGNKNTAATSANLMAFVGYKDFVTYNTTATANTVDTNTDYTGQTPISSYAYVDVVHGTSFAHYLSGYLSPLATNYAAGAVPFQASTTSSGSVMGFGRLSFVSEADYGSKPPFEFRLGMYKAYGLGTVPGFGATPQFVSVGNCFGANGQVAMGVPISTVGEFDPSWGPQIGANWDTVMWRWQNVYYMAKISTTPIRPIQKITANLYKINTISPVNVVSVSDKQLLLGSNDYNSSTLITMSATAGATASFGAAQIQMLSNQKTAAQSIDLGGFSYANPASALPASVLPLAATAPAMHQSSNYFTTLFYCNGVNPLVNAIANAWKSDGSSILGSTLNATFANQLVPASATYIAQTSVVPVPLASRYSGYTIGTNSSATSLAFGETYITSGYFGTTITSEWDGYIAGNQLPLNSVSFALFNQPYLFDGKAIYRLTINAGGVQVPLTVLCRADGLTYMATSQQYAFFFDSFDNSVWAFDGGYTLKKIKRLDGFGAIAGGNYSAFDSSLTINTANAMVFLRDGLWSAVPKLTSMVPDGTETQMRLYDTTRGTVFGNTFNWWNYQYFAPDPVSVTTANGIVKTSSIVPLNFQTGYIGPDGNMRMTLSGITFGVYNGDKPLTVLTATVMGYDQDGFFQMEKAVFKIQPADWINGGLYRGRIQPQKARWLGASVRFECATDVRLFDLQYHWKEEAQANVSPSRSV